MIRLAMATAVLPAIGAQRAPVVQSAVDGRLLAEHRGADLGRAIVRPGLRHAHETPHVVGPGMRAVVNGRSRCRTTRASRRRWSMPSSWTWVGAFRSLDAVIAGQTWSETDASPKTLERPDPNAVVRFP